MIAVVPAKGTSQAVPRKNLRYLNGKPLLFHKLDVLSRVPEISEILVSTEDDRIAAMCEMRGFGVIRRDPALSRPEATIAQVVWDTNLEQPLGVFQVTSPTLSSETISRAIQKFTKGEADTLLSVVADTHFLWTDEGKPLSSSRQNRQYQKPLWRETGGILLTRHITPDSCIGPNVELFPLLADEAVDIDTPADLVFAASVQARRSVWFQVIVGEKVGTGHLYRALLLADQLVGHRVVFNLIPPAPEWAYRMVSEAGYECGSYHGEDVVILDRLDTDRETVATFQALGSKVVTFEDLGEGSEIADLVVNELYDDRRPGVLSGPKFAVLRPEFADLPVRAPVGRSKRLLVTFGGCDAARLSERLIRASRGPSVDVRVVQGPGSPEIRGERGVTVVRDAVMAREMWEADLVVTSAGRTVHEAAACGTPVLSIAANEREMAHDHCRGVLHLGHHALLTDEQLRSIIGRVLADEALRRDLSSALRENVDHLGTERIVSRIEGLLREF